MHRNRNRPKSGWEHSAPGWTGTDVYFAYGRVSMRKLN